MKCWIEVAEGCRHFGMAYCKAMLSSVLTHADQGPASAELLRPEPLAGVLNRKKAWWYAEFPGTVAWLLTKAWATIVRVQDCIISPGSLKS